MCHQYKARFEPTEEATHNMYTTQKRHHQATYAIRKKKRKKSVTIVRVIYLLVRFMLGWNLRSWNRLNPGRPVNSHGFRGKRKNKQTQNDYVSSRLGWFIKQRTSYIMSRRGRLLVLTTAQK